jgi:hypothetical protein
LSHEDVETLRKALNDAADRFKTKALRAVLALSEKYVNLHGSIPPWSYKFFEKLATQINDEDLQNYMIALTTRDEKN